MASTVELIDVNERAIEGILRLRDDVRIVYSDAVEPESRHFAHEDRGYLLALNPAARPLVERVQRALGRG